MDQAPFLTFAPSTAAPCAPHRIVIVPPLDPEEVRIENLATTAERLGLLKIATALRKQLATRDIALLESAAFAVGATPELGSALVQFAVKDGALRCRAWLSDDQEDRLLEALGAVRGATRIDVDIVS